MCKAFKLLKCLNGRSNKQTKQQSKEWWEIPKHIFMQTQKQHNNPANNNGETPLHNVAN